jgi:hypothetical protein
MNNRAEKLKMLNRAFNEGDISLVADASKKDSIVLDIRKDKGVQRQEVATFGNGLTLWNYSNDEAEAVRKKLKTQYEIVWVTEYEIV